MRGREYFRRQPMEKFSFPVFTLIFTLMLGGLLSVACTHEDSKKPDKPQATAASAVAVPIKQDRPPTDKKMNAAADVTDSDRKIRQWETIQDVALEKYDTCLESCDNSPKCIDTCEQAYVHGLAAEYKIMLGR